MSETPKDDEYKDDAQKGGFLGRWSSRKQRAKAAPLPEPAPEPQVLVEEEPFDLTLLPKLEDLTGESDLSVFLHSGVPDEIKNAAMRRVWALDTGIANYLGPVDYAWDFNDPAGIPGFGPLGPEVDVAGMLKQVIGEREPSAQGLEKQELAENDSDALKPVPEPTSSVRRHEKPVLLPPDHAQIALQPDDGRNFDPESDAALSLPRKRHGGAVPC
jgi:Protein of unknown function (DUF3306)